MVGSSLKIISKLSCESRKFKAPVKVMTSLERVIEQIQFIFEVSEEVSAVGIRDLGVDKRLDGTTD